MPGMTDRSTDPSPARAPLTPQELAAIEAHFAWSFGISRIEAARVVADAMAIGATRIDAVLGGPHRPDPQGDHA
jgi:hypothetical protein